MTRDPAPPSDEDALVLGTAGHIDHGKTALVRALTGRDLDQLPEEKARGITIELGFAPLELPSGARVAVIDVPGHERFVRTMVAGASGLDLVMLVVAADEGVMPQTREHLAICELLGVTRGLAVLTKSDLVDEETCALAEEELRDLLEAGPLAEIPVVACSAETGEGIDAVRETLESLVLGTPARRDDARPARLFIDRTFTKHGFGTVVTGTWSGRPLAPGDAVVLEPGARKGRIRGLERHGAATNAAISGARIAVNLQGIDQQDVHRGDLLAEPHALLASESFDASLHWMTAARSSLEEPTSVELLTGTSERRARIAPIGEKPVAPGDHGFARLHVEGPALALLPGDRFVVRGFARDAGVGATLGGGIVLDIAPPRRRRRDPALLRDLERLSGGELAECLEVRIVRAGLEGIARERLALEVGLDPKELTPALDALAERESILPVDDALCLARESAERLMTTLLETLDAYHRSEPLQPGMPRASLLGALPSNVPATVSAPLLAELARRGEVEIRGESVTRTTFEARLDDAQQALAERLSVRLRDVGLEAPALRTLAEEQGIEVERVRELAHFLERQGALVAAPDELFFDRNAVQSLVDRVLAHFDGAEELDTQTLKTLIGTSRRTAMPLMALLDELQVTRRDGSIRRLVSRSPRWR